MLPLFLILLSVAILSLVIGLARLWWYRRHRKPLPAIVPPREEGCCGQHEVCEKDSLLAAVSRKVDYYNDEELDRYRHRPADCYAAEEVEEFQEILYTMRSDEVAGWVRSLQLRGIELPDEVRDEVLLIVSERRSGT